MLELEADIGLLQPEALALPSARAERAAAVEGAEAGQGRAVAGDLGPTRLLSQAVRRARLLRLAQRGLPASQAARAIGCSMGVAAEAYRDPAFRRAVLGKIEGMFAEVDASYEQKQLTLHERITAKGDAAFDRLCLLLEKSANEQLVAKIAMDILDRCPEASTATGIAGLDAETMQAAEESAAVMDGNVVTFPVAKVPVAKTR